MSCLIDKMTPRPGLAHARKRAGFNQEAFAEELGVTKHTVSQWETGATGINARRRPAIATALGISLDELDRLISGEPLTAPAQSPRPEPVSVAVSDRLETEWLIDADRLPRRPYAPVPLPATGLILSANQGETGLSRARRIIDELIPIIRIKGGPPAPLPGQAERVTASPHPVARHQGVRQEHRR